MFDFRVAAAAATFAASVGGAQAATYTPDVLSDNVRGSGVVSSLSDTGIVTFRDFLPLSGGGTGAFIVRKDSGGGTTLQGIGGTFSGRGMVSNNVGQVTSISTVQSIQGEVLQVIDPDGSRRNVAYRGNNTAGGFSGFEVREFLSLPALNDNGDIAVLVRALDGSTQILRFDAAGTAPTLIATANSQDIFNFSSPDISNDGTVAWKAQSPSGAEVSPINVYTSDGSGVELALSLSVGGGIGLGPDLNENGGVLGYSIRDLEFAPAGADPVTGKQVVASDADLDGILRGYATNDFGQYAWSDDSGLYIDGTLVLGVGETLPGIGGTIAAINPARFDTFNNSGQIIANVFTSNNEEYIVRFDPPGGSSDNPLVPFASTPEGQNDVALNIFNGLGVDAPIWVDPVYAEGFTYSLDAGAPNFASLVLPDTLPLSQSVFDLAFDYADGSFTGTIGLGEAFDFLAYDPLGISAFTIFGIDLAEMVDPTDPFVVGLTFVEGGFQSVLSIDAITVDTDAPAGGGDGAGGGPGGGPSVIPLPASAWLLIGAFAGLAAVRRKRSAS